MTQDHALESQLERLLKYGTVTCSVVIAFGVLLDLFSAEPIPVNLVSVGIVGFIALPVMRLLAMLIHYSSSRDNSMMRVVALVLILVASGVILGIFW